MSVVAEIPCHTDLHPGRNVYLTSWFILSVLFLTGSEVRHVSVVPPTHVLTRSPCVVFHTDMSAYMWPPHHTDLGMST